MLKSENTGSMQEVILPDFFDDDNTTTTTTVTKSRRVSFGTNIVKEFIVGSAVSAQCMLEYEQAFASSDSSNADSSQSVFENCVVDQSIFVAPESQKVHKSVSSVCQPTEPDSVENRPKPPKFSSTICFSVDSPTADMEFTEGCITLAKSILDKKNKEMTVIIQAKPKEPKDEEAPKDEETKYFEGSQFEMSVTRCLKPKENRREEKFDSDKRIFNKFEDDMNITKCNKVFYLDDSESSSSSFLNPNPFDFSNESEKLNLNESMDITLEIQPNVLEGELTNLNGEEKSNSNESMEISGEFEEIKSGEDNEPNPEGIQNVSDEPIFDEPAEEITDRSTAEPEPKLAEITPSDDKSTGPDTSEEPDEVEREPSLVDMKVIESLKDQSKEPGCVWSLEDFRHPQAKSPGWLSVSCVLLESTATIFFSLKLSSENSLNSCSTVTKSEVSLNEEKQYRLPEYELVIDFGFEELKRYFGQHRQKVETIRLIPYFLDQINSFAFKTNSYLRQIYSILTLCPGSRLTNSLLSFRLYSFPIFFSCLVSIDLKNLFSLSDSSLSFESEFGSFDENKIREVFQKCLKCENSLCEFVVMSTKYLFDLEKKSGYVSKRRHIKLLPPDLKL